MAKVTHSVTILYDCDVALAYEFERVMRAIAESAPRPVAKPFPCTDEQIARAYDQSHALMKAMMASPVYRGDDTYWQKVRTSLTALRPIAAKNQ